MSEIKEECVEVIYSEPNQVEINMLKGTINANELAELEKEEIVRDFRKEYITKVKVIALDMCGKPLTANPTNMSNGEKQKIMFCMETLLNDTEEEISEKFNALVSEKMFQSTANFEKIYNK